MEEEGRDERSESPKCFSCSSKTEMTYLENWLCWFFSKNNLNLTFSL